MKGGDEVVKYAVKQCGEGEWAVEGVAGVDLLEVMVWLRGAGASVVGCGVQDGVGLGDSVEQLRVCYFKLRGIS